MEVIILAFQDIKAAERESFIDKLYFYLFDQVNGDYNAIAYPQPDSPTVMGGGNRGEE